MKTRHDRANNPAMIFYLGNSEKVRMQEGKLQRETEELRKVLLLTNESTNENELVETILDLNHRE